jgi:hypothetical protein
MEAGSGPIFDPNNNYALRESINSTSTLGGRQNDSEDVFADRTNMIVNPSKNAVEQYFE